MNKTNKTAAKKQLDKPWVTEEKHVAQPNIRSTAIKKEGNPLAAKLVNTTDPPKINKGDEGVVKEGDGGTSGIILTNSVMLVMTMHFINQLLLPWVMYVKYLCTWKNVITPKRESVVTGEEHEPSIRSTTIIGGREPLA